MTKREVLISVCENVGWEPPQPVASSVDRALVELQREGWIRPRLDGWEATGLALQEYPEFKDQDDIRGNPIADVVTSTFRPPLDWTELALPLMTLREGQRMEAQIDSFGVRGTGITGTIAISNTSQTADQREVEIIVRVRRLP